MATADREQHGGSRTANVLSRTEIDEILARNCWGVLAMVEDDAPYAVQVIYGYNGVDFVFANGPGRKFDVLQKNSRVSLVITEVENYGKRWRSVIIKGTVTWIDDLGGKISAFNTLRKQIPFAGQRVRDVTKLASAKVARIIPTEISGRTAG